MRFHCAMLLLLGALICVSGCSKAPNNRVKTYPVKGKVTVDGKEPGSSIQIACHPDAGMNAEFPTFSQSETNPDGTFEIATYEKGDGVPAGDYTLTFTWQEFNLMSRNYGGPDKLNKRYSDPKNSPIKITVQEGEPLDLGVIALTTK